MNVQPSYGTALDAVAPVDSSTVALTPDALLAYCQSQIDSIDSSVQGYMAGQKQTAETKQALGSTMDGLRAWAQQIGGAGKDTNQDKIDAFTDQLKALQEQCPQAAKSIGDAIQILNTDAKGGDGTDATVSTTDIEKAIEDLSDVNTQLDSASQLTMIKLQSAMSQREQAIQLTTNILQTLNDGATKVIGNIHG